MFVTQYIFNYLQPICRPYLLDYGMSYEEYVTGLQGFDNPPDILAIYATSMLVNCPMTIVTRLTSWSYKFELRRPDPMQVEITLVYNGSFLFTSTSKYRKNKF